MFEVKWFLFKSEKEMNTDKILPIDLYHAVSTANLTLESTLKIIHVEVGQDHELLPLEPGTLAVICRGGKFECKALGKEISIVAGQVFLASVEDVSDISRFSETGFEGIVIYAGSDLLINRQLPDDYTGRTGGVRALYPADAVTNRANERCPCQSGGIAFACPYFLPPAGRTSGGRPG